jgi:hypothetical protein
VDCWNLVPHCVYRPHAGICPCVDNDNATVKPCATSRCLQAANHGTPPLSQRLCCPTRSWVATLTGVAHGVRRTWPRQHQATGWAATHPCRWQGFTATSCTSPGFVPLCRCSLNGWRWTTLTGEGVGRGEGRVKGGGVSLGDSSAACPALQHSLQHWPVGPAAGTAC